MICQGLGLTTNSCSKADRSRKSLVFCARRHLPQIAESLEQCPTRIHFCRVISLVVSERVLLQPVEHKMLWASMPSMCQHPIPAHLTACPVVGRYPSSKSDWSALMMCRCNLEQEARSLSYISSLDGVALGIGFKVHPPALFLKSS